MTVPALPNAPQIGSTGLIQEPGIAQQIAPLLDALAQQRLVSAQIQAYKTLTDERRAKAAQAAQTAKDAADAASAFYQHISGSQQRLKPAQPGKDGAPQHNGVDETSGMLMPLPQFEKGLSPGAHDSYMAKIAEHNKVVQQGLEGARTKVAAEHEQVLTDIAQAGQARDTAVRQVLAGYAGKLNTPAQQAKAIADVAAIDPQAAQGLASTFNQGAGRYNHVVGPDGFLYILDTKLGTARKDTAVGQKVALNQEAIRRGAQTVVDLFDEATGLLKKNAAADIDPVVASTLEHARVLGVPLAAGANIGRTDEQQQFRLLRTRFAHNYVGLLPHSRSAANLLQNLTESYFAPPGSSAATRQRAQKDRLHLRAVLDALARGQSTDLSKLPGFAEAAQAAAAEGTAPTGGTADPSAAPPNPADWLQGPPP